MRNKGLIIALTIIVSLLSFYYISFTYVAQGIQEEAVAQSKDSTGVVNTSKKQSYLDSLYDKPVYNFLGMVPYTYKEVKDMELALGLDLQGGMHVVLEVSPVEILKALAGAQAESPLFKQALNKAKLAQSQSQESFEKLFYASYKEIAGPDQLARVFSNSQNSAKIRSTSTDKEVQKMIDEEIDAAVDRSFEILRSRIDRFGAIQPNLQRIQGTGRILVELPGVENPQRVRKLLQGTAKLDFYDVYSLGEIQGGLMAVNDYLVAQTKLTKDGKGDLQVDTTATVDELAADPLASDDTTGVKKDSLELAAKADSTEKDTLADKISVFFSLRDRNYPYTLHYNIKDSSQINRILKQAKVKELLPSDLMFLWDWKADTKTGAMELVPIRKSKGGKSLLTGEAISDAHEEVSQDGKAAYGISMQMNPAGAKKWKKITSDAIKDSQNKRRVAIVLDNVVYSAPTVQSEIPNGSSSITGNFTQEDAKDIANILKAGKLPAPVRIVEEVIVGPTLGQEAIESGLMSLLAGLLVVIVLMVVYYNKGGLVADIALVFNVIFTLGFLASLNSVLTLPGLAGIVLSLGMSVDANVLIFERIKEERKNGKGMRAAIDAGFDKAFSSIFDSNVTTILTGVILFFLGSGPIKGFAITLIIGIACSFFTSVFISRVILLWLTRGSNAETAVSFTTVLSKNLFQNLNFDFVKFRKAAYGISIALLLFGAAATVLNGGLNLGVDFKGGRSYIVEFNKDVVASDLKASLSDEFQGTGTEVKTYGSAKKVKVTTSYLVEDESERGDTLVEGALKKGLKEFNQGDSKILSSNKVGATVADDILQSSWQSIIVSLIGIFIYVLLRFRKWQFGLGGIIALFHDTLMVLAMFSILQFFGVAAFEVDQVIIAALLTIVGFSINDTVIVFDRVREFGDEYYKMDMKDMLNKSINSTLSRTIMTTVTVLVTVIILCIFGGESLRGFSISLLVGVVFGSYSTIFIAIPMVLDLRSKKDAEAKRVN
ncbi:MAG: secDF [Cytophagaceae bacterium]|jgi:SecD/SecF fusion protein|nr:secDF [Cytophagaceae bacterium]